MILPRKIVLRLATCLGASLLIPATLFAAEPPSVTGAVSPSNPPTPILPKLNSPVSVFRELLALTPAARKLALTNRPPEAQKRILAKLREYESLRRDEREARLGATELQWYLTPLMSLPRTNRAARLALIPDDQRKLVEQRLTRWDALSPALQEELLSNETTARYFTQLETATDDEKRKILEQMSPERRAKLEAGLGRWRGLSEEERRKTLDRFSAFFELKPEEMEKVLNTLSESEQRQMDKTLQAYANLPAVQRAQCIRSFEKFTGMSLEERQLFLKNAERWKLMSQAERDAWRKLVDLAPLRPPVSTPPLPPLPPLRRPKEAFATNTN